MDNSIENKNQTLDTLFSIRAGLSYISELKDKISATSTNKSNNLSACKTIDNQICENEKTLDTEKHNCK